MIVIDTGGLYAALDATEALHGRAVAALVAAAPPRLLSPFVLAELDYLVGTRVGHQAQLSLADEVTRGVYQLEDLTLATGFPFGHDVDGSTSNRRCRVP